MRSKIVKPLNAELVGVDAALRRAAKAAQALARKTKTPCYVWKDDKIVDVTPTKARRQVSTTTKHQ